MKIVGIITICIVTIFFTSGSAETLPSEKNIYIPQILTAPSFIPEEESYIHIAGGLFSVFEGRNGVVFNNDRINHYAEPKWYNQYRNQKSFRGSIQIKLQSLEYESRFVYLPKGNITVTIDNNVSCSFLMDKLDYTSAGEDGFAYYRIKCTPGTNCSKDTQNAYLICFAIEGSNPVLLGSLSVTSHRGIQKCYPVRIHGRGGNEADNHLHKVIARVSHFTF